MPPVEAEVDMALGIPKRQQVFGLGIGKYNRASHSFVPASVAD